MFSLNNNDNRYHKLSQNCQYTRNLLVTIINLHEQLEILARKMQGRVMRISNRAVEKTSKSVSSDFSERDRMIIIIKIFRDELTQKYDSSKI